MKYKVTEKQAQEILSNYLSSNNFVKEFFVGDIKIIMSEDETVEIGSDEGYYYFANVKTSNVLRKIDQLIDHVLCVRCEKDMFHNK